MALIRSAGRNVRTVMQRSPFASRSVHAHYLRGAIGLLALVAAVAGAAAGVPTALALLVVTVAAWRGCPTCWAIGLRHTRNRAACSGRGCRGPSA